MGQSTEVPASVPRRVVFKFDGRPIEAFEGDTIAGALVRAGVHTFSRSMKFHRPRGLYCGSGTCISCVMRVNGLPWVRTCITPVADGTVVESRGGVPSVRHDALSVLDLVFRTEFEYRSRFIRPRFMTPLYQRIVRSVAASFSLPDGTTRYPRITERNCRVLVIGQGVSGSVASAALRGADVRGVVSIDRMACSAERIPSTAFGIYEGREVGVLVGDEVQIVRPESILLATGRMETGLPLQNGDLPGVLLPAALAQLAGGKIAPGRRAAVVGRNDRHGAVLRHLESLGMTLVADIPDAASVVRIRGRGSVSGIETVDHRVLACDAVVVEGPLVPDIGLAQQAGCELASSDGVLVVKAGADGRTSEPKVFACGTVAGGMRDQAERISSAQRAADAIAHEIGVG